ncbi:cupin domain-containing protein [Aliivibrio fischeri]|uniref:cupin domain-containing protein n=1 Tax=Aliivibrio fischeri TaxID=668 RepID=UPI0007C598B7|nr:cupin domain-containing protein [Aliivibrio fischeri]
MKLHTDLSKHAHAIFSQSTWIPSPIKEVSRKMLERDGGEIATATTLVHYEPNSYFSSHIHTGGEEFFVLDGTFADEYGDYPIGTYMRNPVGSSHAPIVEAGCMILVKLGQYQEGDTTPVHIDTHAQDFLPDPSRHHVQYQTLHSFKHESVRLEKWQANQTIELENQGGIELLVLEGKFTHDNTEYQKFDWLRLPIGHSLHASIKEDTCKVWIKTGHHLHQIKNK